MIKLEESTLDKQVIIRSLPEVRDELLEATTSRAPWATTDNQVGSMRVSKSGSGDNSILDWVALSLLRRGKETLPLSP